MLFKKVICLILISCLVLFGVACGGGSNNAENGSGSGSGSNGGGGTSTVTAKISADLLDGKVANLLGAKGIGIVDKTEQTDNSAATFKAATVKTATTCSVRVYDDDGASVDVKQKDTELVKNTEEGVADVCFYEPENGEKSYKDLNNKFAEHHHDGVKCDVENCDKLSDEIIEEEKNGEADTVISLDARVNKLYSIGKFTFMSVSSAVKGEYNVITILHKPIGGAAGMMQQWGELAGYPTQICPEEIDGNLSFSWIKIRNGGVIPIKATDAEKEFHTSNYWSDDYNQSYIIDNDTGITYSLSDFKYIYSVSGGILKIYNEDAVGSFDYYKPVIGENGIEFVKYEFYPEILQDAETLSKIGGGVYTDIFGNVVFYSGVMDNSQKPDENGEIKVGDNMILGQKAYNVYSELDSARRRCSAYEYRTAFNYQLGSDGRIYRVNFTGNMKNVSVNVLDENCEWQQVENDVNVQFDFGLYTGFISYGIGERVSMPAYYKMTCISEGYAYYSTAACFDGAKVYGCALYSNYESDSHFVGVVKMSVNGNDDGVEEFLNNVKSYCGEPLNNPYSVILIGNTQMLYFFQHNNDKSIYLWDVKTGENKYFDFNFRNYYCSGGDVHNNLYVEGLGYLNIENEIDFASFGANSFSQTPVYQEAQFDEYYKLLTEK